MSFKIEDPQGIVIGGVRNPSVTIVYIRVLANMANQSPIYTTEVLNEGQENEQKSQVMTEIGIYAELLPSENGALFPTNVLSVYDITPVYNGRYSVETTLIEEKYLEVEEYIKDIIISQNPELEGKITIVDVPNEGVE